MIIQIIINGIIAGLSWALIAVGFNLIYGTVRFIHAAHAATYLVGAYAGIWFIRHTTDLYIVAILVSMVAAMILGLLIEIAVYRPLRKRGSSSPILFLASLAVIIVVQNMVSLIFGSEVQVVQERLDSAPISVFEASVSKWRMISSGIDLLLLTTTWWIMQFTTIGKRIRAVASEPYLAQVVGINQANIIVVVMCVGSALAGTAGFLGAYDTAITPTASFGVLLMGVTAAIVGGIGSIRGAVLGGLLVGILQHMGVWKLPTQWQDTIIFIVLLLFLLFRPLGFFGRPLKKVTL